jgi:hypothetical protein
VEENFSYAVSPKKGWFLCCHFLRTALYPFPPSIAVIVQIHSMLPT